MAAEMVGYKDQKKLGKDSNFGADWRIPASWPGYASTHLRYLYCSTCRLRAQFKRQCGKRSPGRGKMV